MKTTTYIALAAVFGMTMAAGFVDIPSAKSVAQTALQNEKQTSILYDPVTGELSVNAHEGLTSIDIDQPRVIISQIPLQRTTYRVPRQKAKPFVDFLNSYVDIKHFAVQYSEERLTVGSIASGDSNDEQRAVTITAGLETQKIIEGFIRLLHHKA